MKKQWWHGKVAYQIYPKSFKDGNGDGIGDLKGICEKLPYLHDLGVEIVWISPIFCSPFADQGYDISNYRDIDPLFGTMEDFDKLKATADSLGIALVLDLVVNHCSDEHPWFKKACLDPSCEEASYFYFREGKDGHAPNNLRSNFGGSVWDLVPGHDNLYYCHFFHKKQPDFNWFNPRLRERIYEMMNWWLVEKGIAGFRIDAIMCIGKDPTFPMYEPDAVGDGMRACGQMNSDHVDVALGFLKEMNERTFKLHNKFAIGEVFGTKDNDLRHIIGDDGVFSSIFDFSAREALTSHYCFYGYHHVDIAEFRKLIFHAQEISNNAGFLAPVFENHDQPRSVSTWLPLMWQNAAGAKALATVLLSLRGLPFLFQGEELGMTNTFFTSLEEFDDCLSHDQYTMSLRQGLSPSLALQILNTHARDHGRTPMLWNASQYAGFSQQQPWMKVHQDYVTLNAQSQLCDPHSVLNFYKQLLQIRKDPRFHETFTYGHFIALADPNEHTLAFLRQGEEQILMIIANFGEYEVSFETNENSSLVLTSGHVELRQDEKRVHVAAGASAIVEL